MPEVSKTYRAGKMKSERNYGHGRDRPIQSWEVSELVGRFYLEMNLSKKLTAVEMSLNDISQETSTGSSSGL
ncbi:hypothetical protein LCGC14_0232360 [marine sediment metagenome]|uniref:Uncharacterized protein n=1 Tax=marine sediment metagenome TaxID=412755 RepID=A0A0F9UAA0_9ZZZZ